MAKIVITEPMKLSKELLERLSKLGQVLMYDTPPSREEWLERTAGIKIVCSGKCGLSDRINGETGTEGIYSLGRGTFVSHPFVNTAWIDAARLKELGITVTYTPGSNKEAVAEWAMYMMLEMFREFSQAINRTEPGLEMTDGLYEKKVVILGAGNVGRAIGKRAEAFEMDVKYFRRGDNIAEILKDAEVVVNCLSSRAENNNFLNRNFFFNMLPDNSYFISMTSPSIYDLDAMIEALDRGKLKMAGIDVGNSFPGDVSHPNYLRVVNHPKTLATPQIAHNTKSQKSYRMMVENIEEYIVMGRLINLVE